MKITRNTLRADGKTVGQAMDEDAAFLRSIGVNCPNEAPTYDEMSEEFREKMRQAVLDAMDEVAAGLTGNPNDGPKDSELPSLFAAIDRISEKIFIGHITK